MDTLERTTELLSTRTAFEAETIAEALRQRGISAQAVDAQNAQLWAGAFGGAKVLVLVRQHEAAKAALEEIRREAQNIDWSQTDAGGADDDVEDSDSASSRRARRRHRRAALTLAMVIVPVGFIVLSRGTLQHNPLVQIIGGTLLALALAIWIIVQNAGREDSQGSPRG